MLGAGLLHAQLRGLRKPSLLGLQHLLRQQHAEHAQDGRFAQVKRDQVLPVDTVHSAHSGPFPLHSANSLAFTVGPSRSGHARFNRGRSFLQVGGEVRQ